MIDSSPHRDEVPRRACCHNQPLALPMNARGFSKIRKLDMIPSTELRGTKREEGRAKREEGRGNVCGIGYCGMEGTLRLENLQLGPFLPFSWSFHLPCDHVWLCPEDRQNAILQFAIGVSTVPDGSILFPSADLSS